MNELPAYRVIYADGTSYVTSMAKGITLDQARAYFVGESFEQFDGRMKRVTDVLPLEQDGNPLDGEGASFQADAIDY